MFFYTFGWIWLDFCDEKGFGWIDVERVLDLVGLAAGALHKIDQITPVQGKQPIPKKYQYFLNSLASKTHPSHKQ